MSRDLEKDKDLVVRCVTRKRIDSRKLLYTRNVFDVNSTKESIIRRKDIGSVNEKLHKDQDCDKRARVYPWKSNKDDGYDKRACLYPGESHEDPDYDAEIDGTSSCWEFLRYGNRRVSRESVSAKNHKNTFEIDGSGSITDLLTHQDRRDPVSRKHHRDPDGGFEIDGTGSISELSEDRISDSASSEILNGRYSGTEIDGAGTFRKLLNYQNLRDSLWRLLDRGPLFGVETDSNGTGCDGKFKEYSLHVDITDDSKHHFKKWLCPILCVMSISVDALFLYIPVVNDYKKCIMLDRDLRILASLLRSFSDFFYIIDIILYQRRSYLLRFFLIDLLAILPLPQLAIFDIFPTIGGLGFWNRMEVLKLFVTFQYVPRVIRIYQWIPGKLVETTWAKAAFNIFLYILAANVFGALWYFLAIERATECWKNACINHSECSHSSFYCDDKLGDYSFLNEFCPTKIRDSSIYDFGIFYDALRSGIVEVTDVPQKFLHCFLWGLKNLSCFGQNLQTSSNFRENLFVISIAICGLVLFFFLVGFMQIYLLSRTVKSKTRPEAQEIEEWMPFQKLSENLRKQVKKYQLYIWRKTKDINLPNLLINVPKELRRNIKRELCLVLLKKVEKFKKLKEATLDALCDRVKPVFFLERTLVVREGGPIYEMLFVVQGILLTYTSKGTTDSAFASIDHSRKSDRNISKRDHLVDGDFYGEELVSWALDDRPLSDIPLSASNILARTNVEGFALMADDLKNVFTNHQVSRSSELCLKRNQAAHIIQLAWRRHQTRRLISQQAQISSKHRHYNRKLSDFK